MFEYKHIKYVFFFILYTVLAFIVCAMGLLLFPIFLIYLFFYMCVEDRDNIIERSENDFRIMFIWFALKDQ